ncbi:hypothetical protein [Paraglaciecola polaris]|uniref:hypothetical protein n=1 Tax=Paraglaciecola polaris TaxID=222814 RepID=UPI0030ED81FB|tara:strand:+ start:1860 stop:2279 length:420 start_codon:yes stop_codon:yes gene_type:complete
MRLVYVLFILFCPSIFTLSNGAEAIIVVANTQDKSIQLNRQQVRNLFMGGALPYDLSAVALPPENQTRVLFNTKVVGLTESRIQSYWAQMRFTGRKKAPKEIESEQLVLEYLKNNQGTIGYLPAGITLPKELTVVYQIH